MRKSVIVIFAACLLSSCGFQEGYQRGYQRGHQWGNQLFEKKDYSAGSQVQSPAVVSVAPVLVRNESVRQEGNRVLFEYDLDGEQKSEVTLALTVKGKEYSGKDLHLEGDIGKVVPGRGKKLWWNVLRDFPRGLDSKIDWELSAEVAR